MSLLRRLCADRCSAERARGEVLRAFGLGESDRVIFSAARLVEVKGLDLMIRAFVAEGLAQRGWKYVIAGVGPLEGQLKSLAGAGVGPFHPVRRVSAAGTKPGADGAGGNAGAAFAL